YEDHGNGFREGRWRLPRQRSGPGVVRHDRTMTALYTFDVFSTLDGYGSYGPEGDWGGYWGKEGPEFLERRLAIYRTPQRLVLGANTMRMFMQSVGPQSGSLKDVDPVNGAMRDLPTTVVSTTL